MGFNEKDLHKDVTDRWGHRTEEKKRHLKRKEDVPDTGAHCYIWQAVETYQF